MQYTVCKVLLKLHHAHVLFLPAYWKGAHILIFRLCLHVFTIRQRR